MFIVTEYAALKGLAQGEMSYFFLDEEMSYFFLVYFLAFSLMAFLYSVILLFVCVLFSSVCVDLLQVPGFTALA